MIRFMFKAAIWGFVALLVLPSLVSHDGIETSGTEAEVNGTATTFHAFRVASAVAADMGAVCERQPAICESGQMLAEAAVVRAQQGLAIASNMLSGDTSPANETTMPADSESELES